MGTLDRNELLSFMSVFSDTRMSLSLIKYESGVKITNIMHLLQFIEMICQTDYFQEGTFLNWFCYCHKLTSLLPLLTRLIIHKKSEMFCLIPVNLLTFLQLMKNN